MFFPTAELASGVPQVLQSQRSPISDPISAEPICTGVGRRGAPRAVSVSVRPRSGKFFGFHNPHYRFPDTELSGIRARAPRQNTDFVAGISDFWRSEAVSAPQAKILRFWTPKVSISTNSRAPNWRRRRGRPKPPIRPHFLRAARPISVTYFLMVPFLNARDQLYGTLWDGMDKKPDEYHEPIGYSPGETCPGA